MSQQTIRFLLDERAVEVGFNDSPELSPTTTLLKYLRSLPGHKGVKEGCAEGDCGACTVVVAESGEDGKLVYKALDSCLVFLPMIHGKQVITVENLAVRKNNQVILHPVQQMLVETNGTQCGYCTPGIVMSLFALYKNHHEPSREVIEDALTGNLCRCTGYQPIVEAALKACTNHGKDQFSDKEKETSDQLSAICRNKSTLTLKTPTHTYLKPFTLAEALSLRGLHPGALVINGATDIAMRQTKSRELLTEILDLSAVDELKTWNAGPDGFIFGAGLSMEQLKKFAAGKLPALYDILSVFGSLQIRNLATLGGNICSASPIGDLLPLFYVLDVGVVLKSAEAERVVPISGFITGYHQTVLQPDELITALTGPRHSVGTLLKTYKISKRKNLDIATVSAAFRLNLNDGMVAGIALAYGGMAETTKRATLTEQYLSGKKWSRVVVENAMKIIESEFSPISDVRSGAEFRKIVARNLLLKFYVETA